MIRPSARYSLLPIELHRRPFINRDNHYKIEIVVPRPKFLFEIDNEVVSVRIGGREVVALPIGDQDSICTLNASILTVYDTYGYDTAVLFLELITEAFCLCMYIKIYIVGSAHALGLTNMTGEDDEHTIVCSIRDKLREMEDEKIKIVDEGVVMSFPIELVALITNSLRISKEVSKLVIARRSSTLPRYRDVVSWSDRPDCTYSLGRWSALCRIGDRSYSCYLRRNDGTDTYYLASNTGTRVPALGCSYVTSLYRYYAYYRSIGCEGDVGVKTVLDDIEARMSTDISDYTICSWVMQLACDTYTHFESQEVKIVDLRTILLSLIATCRSRDFDS